jgi:hypothetical protein
VTYHIAGFIETCQCKHHNLNVRLEGIKKLERRKHRCQGNDFKKPDPVNGFMYNVEILNQM